MLLQNASLSSTFHFWTTHPLYATFIHKSVIIYFTFEQKWSVYVNTKSTWTLLSLFFLALQVRASC